MGKEYSAEVVQLFYDYMGLKRRLGIVLPRQLMDLKKHIPHVEAYRVHDYDVFLRVARALYHDGARTMGQLSDSLEVPANTATRMVDWLVNNGYAQRLPDPEDRRVVRVLLTDGGRELYQAISSTIEQLVDRVLSGITIEERRSLVSLLRKVYDTVVKEVS